MKLSVACGLVVFGLIIGIAPGTIQAQSDYEDDPSVAPTSFDPLYRADPETGVRFQADALYWTRTNSDGGGSVIGGPQRFGFGSLNNSYVGGYRLGLGWLIDSNYEVEGVWTQLSDWSSGANGPLTRAVSFDNGHAKVVVDPSGNANFINTGTFFRPLYGAATDSLGGGPNNENTEYEFLKPGSHFSLYSTSSLQDAQANFKTRRSADQRFSFGLGYRNIRFNEGASAGISGTFGIADVVANTPGNGGLSDQALTANGLTLLSGAADGWTVPANGITTLSMLWNGATTNQLNGLQGTVDATIFERGPFALEGLLRAGLFYNQINSSIREVYAGGGADNSVYGRSFQDHKDTASFAGNLGLRAVYRISNHVSLRGGYEAMFLTNVATAAAQQQGITYDSLGAASYSIRNNSSVVFHGANAGVEVVW